MFVKWLVIVLHSVEFFAFLGMRRTLFHLVVNGDTSEFNAGGNPAMA